MTGKLSNAKSTTPNANTSITGNSLLQGVYKVNQETGGNGKLVLDDYSKVLDEYGEPLVVYHGSGQWFTEFNNGQQIQHSQAPANTIFTTTEL